MWGIGFYFISPYQIGLLAALDRRGRAAVAAGGVMNFGYALGPSIAGRTLQNLDADALLVVIVGMTVLSMLLVLPLAMRIERGSHTVAVGPRTLEAQSP
jgi:predicted MFS family arabinose efflux permease